jgi:hypothetical protein
MAACTLVMLLAHVVLAQLTLLLAAAFIVAGRVSRWRPWWLLCPASAGLLWTLVTGPETALAGLSRGPARVLGYFGGGHLAPRLAHPLAAFAGAFGWLPAQAPLALICAAAEAAAVCWLDWLHTGQWGAQPTRPGPLAVLRGTLGARVIREGGVLTRAGCALGIVPATGALAGLSWAELAEGALVTGVDPTEVTISCLQVIHAALRRRKPLIVLDGGDDTGVPLALAAACRATGTPLWRGRPGFTGQPGLIGRAVGDRCAVLLAAGSPELATEACAELAAAQAQLRRIGVDGDALIWVTTGARLPAALLATTIREGGAVGLPVLTGTVSPEMSAAVAGLVGTVLVHRLADEDLADTLAATAAASAQPGLAAAASVAPRVLLSLRPGQFVLAVRAPRPRLVTAGQVVPARLPAGRTAS